jgi:hypothetical protein
VSNLGIRLNLPCTVPMLQLHLVNVRAGTLSWRDYSIGNHGSISGWANGYREKGSESAKGELILGIWVSLRGEIRPIIDSSRV